MNSKITTKSNKKQIKNISKKSSKKGSKKSSKKGSKRGSKKDSKKNSKKISKLKRQSDPFDDDSEDESPKGLSDDINETFDFNGYLKNLNDKIDKEMKQEDREKKENNYQHEEITDEKMDEEPEEKMYIESLDKKAGQINILEQFINTNGKIVILITGMPCTDKSAIAKILSEDLNNNLRPTFTNKKVSLINLKDYFLESKYETVEVKKENAKPIKYKVYETSANYDWEALNKEMLKDNGGAIIFGNYIDTDKLEFKINFSFFLDMSVSLCKKVIEDKKILPITKNGKDNEIKLNAYFEHVFIPIYDKMKEQVRINKFFNVKTGSEEEINKIYDNLYNALTSLIQKSLD